MTKIYENLWVKVAAILLAILLWFHVATEKKYQYEITLNINQIDIPEGLILAEPPEGQITVLVSATGKRLLRSDWKRSGVKVTLTRSNPGTFRSDISLANASLIKSDGLDLLEIISPREVKINCDFALEKTVPVKSRVDFIPGDGYVVDENIVIVPDSITLYGPRRNILKIDSVETYSETYRGIRNNLEMEVGLDYPDFYGLIIEPDTVTLLVTVLPIKSRLFIDIPVQLVNAMVNDSVMIDPATVELRVGGKAEIIDSLRIEDITARADYDRADSTGAIPIEFDLPPSVSIMASTSDTVKIISQ
jgi:YbbR domain-containing protein